MLFFDFVFSVQIAEFTKECSEVWKNMGAGQKKKFEDLAAADKARYDGEMAKYKGKSKVDDGKPKKPQTAYFLFLADFRVKMKGKNVEHKEILKLGNLFDLIVLTVTIATLIYNAIVAEIFDQYLFDELLTLQSLYRISIFVSKQPKYFV